MISKTVGRTAGLNDIRWTDPVLEGTIEVHGQKGADTMKSVSFKALKDEDLERVAGGIGHEDDYNPPLECNDPTYYGGQPTNNGNTPMSCLDNHESDYNPNTMDEGTPSW